MSIAAHLIDIAAFLDKEIDSDDKRRVYGYWGHCTKVVSCTYAIRYDKTGVIDIEALDNPTAAPQWTMSRTSGALPYPFCDNIKQFTDKKNLPALKTACKRALKMDNLPEPVEAWCNNIDNFTKAIEAFNVLPKGVKEKEKASQNIVFYYGDSAIPLSQMPAIRDFVRANDYLFFNTWFDCIPDTRLDAAERWYDVIDDRELKRSEVCVAHIGFKLGATPDIKLVSFNKKTNDTADSWGSDKGDGKGFNYPMSHEHGRMMDAAIIWLADYSIETTNEKTGKTFKRKPFIFSHENPSTGVKRNYLWFPILNDSVGNIDSFIEKAEMMPKLFTKLLSGERPDGLETDENGNAVAYCDVPPEWLSDDGINLFEITVEGRRATANKNPFSLESLIRSVDAYERENETHGGAVSHFSDFRTSLALTLSGKVDYNNPSFERLWEDYTQKHILGRRAVSKEILHALRQALVYGDAPLKASLRRAMLVELAKASKSTPDELAKTRPFALGKWCNKIASAQKSADKPQSFRGDMMRSIYFGKVDVGAEITAYTTLSEENAKTKATRHAKHIEENDLKYFIPKSRLSNTLNSLAIAHKKSEKGEGYSIGAIINDGKRFADRPMVRTDKERNAFIIGYMSGLCKEIFIAQENGGN